MTSAVPAPTTAVSAAGNTERARGHAAIGAHRPPRREVGRTGGDRAHEGLTGQDDAAEDDREREQQQPVALDAGDALHLGQPEQLGAAYDVDRMAHDAIDRGLERAEAVFTVSEHCEHVHDAGETDPPYVAKNALDGTQSISSSVDFEIPTTCRRVRKSTSPSGMMPGGNAARAAGEIDWPTVIVEPIPRPADAREALVDDDLVGLGGIGQPAVDDHAGHRTWPRRAWWEAATPRRSRAGAPGARRGP